MKIFRTLLITQSAYTFLTALWPLIHIESFLLVTGYKTDIWLVKTVGALLIPIAATLFSYLFTRTDRTPALILGAFTSLAFIVVDFYYSTKDIISDIYQLDGFVEIIFLALWIYLLAFRFREIKNNLVSA
jgi:hypothetical protein